MKSTLLKVADRTNLGFTYLPGAILVLGFVLAGWMRLTLGRWPVMYLDEPQGVAVVLGATVLYLAVGVLIWLPTWLLTLPCVWLRRGCRPVARRAVLFTVGVVAVFSSRWWAQDFVFWLGD